MKFPDAKELSSSSGPGDKFQDCIHSLIYHYLTFISHRNLGCSRCDCDVN